jgi:hypothetical protein
MHSLGFRIYVCVDEFDIDSTVAPRNLLGEDPFYSTCGKIQLSLVMLPGSLLYIMSHRLDLPSGILKAGTNARYY